MIVVTLTEQFVTYTVCSYNTDHSKNQMVQTSTHKWECETFQHISVFAVFFCFLHIHHCVHMVCMYMCVCMCVCVYMCVHMCVCVWVLLLGRVTENKHVHFILAQLKLLLRWASPTLYSKRTVNDFSLKVECLCIFWHASPARYLCSKNYIWQTRLYI